VVVPQHQGGHLVGHLVQQLVPGRGRDDAVPDRVGEQDLDVDLVVGGVDPGGVIDEVGVHQPAAEGVLDPGRLGEAEVAALADDAGAQPAGVDPDRVVGPVPHVGVGFGAGLHVGADPAVPEQVHRGGQDGGGQLVRGHHGFAGVD